MFSRYFNFSKQTKNNSEKENKEIDKEVLEQLNKALESSKQLEIAISENPKLESSYESIKSTNQKMEETINNFGKPYTGPPVTNELIKNSMQEIINKSLDLQENIIYMNQTGKFDEAIDNINKTVKRSIEINDRM